MRDNEPDTPEEDGVSSYPATEQQMRTYPAARQALAQFQAPVLVHAGNPHARLYVACFDGTGNDVNKDPAHATNVAKIYKQILENSGNPQIAGGYVPGPGTQDGWWARTVDSATGGTYEPRIEKMYALFIDQAKRWRDADPNAQIRLADIGFSRGSEQAAGFARLVHERGIQDHSGVIYQTDADGMITGVRYAKPPLVAPGQVPQVEGLFDAVGTGEPYQHDRRPPPSVISGLHIMAQDERRSVFPSDRIIDPGLTPDGRFLGVTVAGAHSDVGGGYLGNGLAIRNGNMMADYLNALSDKPFLQKSQEPDGSRLNMVHRSEEAAPFNIMPTVKRDQPAGYNERLVPQNVEYVSSPSGDGIVKELRSERPGVQDPLNAEPRDELLNGQFRRQPVRSAAAPAPAQTQAPPQSLQQPRQDNPGQDVWARVDQILAAAGTGNQQEFRAGTQALAAMPVAQEMQAQARETVDLQEQLQAAQQAREAQQSQMQQQDALVMRMSY